MEKVTDLERNIHSFDENDLLGEGGQGAVYRTKDGDIALKIDTSKETLESFNKKVDSIKYKPLPPLDIILPLVGLKDKKGYIMRLLDNYKPLSDITSGKLNEIDNVNVPHFLQEMLENKELKYLALKILHYRKSGGLRARLYILKHIAFILSSLHLHGMVYCDLSPNNVFVNNDDIPLVKLIDADNIEYADKVNSSIYTPNYEIPEIDKGEKNSLYSDIYAFAILSFYLLTMTYPFRILQSDWDSESSDTQQAIWEYPWIESSLDFSTQINDGLRGALSTAPLYELFDKTLEEGKLDKFKRPIMPLWLKEINKALNDTLKCSECKMSYFDSYFDECPYCNSKKPPRIVIDFNGKKVFARELDCLVPLNIIENDKLDSINEVLFEIKKNNDYIYIIKKLEKNTYMDNKLVYAKYKKNTKNLTKGLEIKIDSIESNPLILKVIL